MSDKLSPESNATFLAENAKRDGVTTTKSGLQIRTLTPGSGKKPGPTQTVTVHYEGKLIDHSVFDSSYSRGDTISFRLNQVIPGWTEGLQLMSEGETAELVIPQDIGYGARGSGRSIPPYQTLIFKVELQKVS
jgi:FKBP-type peptidyl-prolyl cis-trans isomerase FkpA/FKBP-type peptidyl-prolyl cis-trans isomerase FklB